MSSCCEPGSLKHKNLQELSEYLKIIGDETRLQILCLLKQGERCVCNIHAPLGLPQNLTSHHLKALRDFGLVNARREGRWIHYSLNHERIEELSALYNQIILGGTDGDQDIRNRLCKLQEA